MQLVHNCIHWTTTQSISLILLQGPTLMETKIDDIFIFFLFLSRAVIEISSDIQYKNLYVLFRLLSIKILRRSSGFISTNWSFLLWLGDFCRREKEIERIYIFSRQKNKNIFFIVSLIKGVWLWIRPVMF